MSDLQSVAQEVCGASSPADIFPNPDPAAIKDVYRRLAKILHPDQYQGADYDVAKPAFQRLGELCRKAEDPLIATIRTKTASYEIDLALNMPADLSHLYRGVQRPSGVTALIKLAKSPADNDLLATEARALKQLHSHDNQWVRHYPALLDTFIYPQQRRRGNALAWHDGMFHLGEIGRAFPDGLDPRHIAWIWRRLLMALGNAHDCGIIHGAVLPPHILIGPADHAVMLVDWCYASILPINGTPPTPDYPTIKAAVAAYEDWYPREILQKQAPTPATDIAMAAKTMLSITPETGKQPFRAFFKGCFAEKQQNRPKNAWILLKEFDDLLESIGEPFYPRRFVEFVVPSGVA